MKVKLYKVHVPAKSSRELDVPRYDVPILRALWPQEQLMTGMQITVMDLGRTEWRDAEAEFTRIQSMYGAQIDGVAAWKVIYGSKADFIRAFRDEARDGERFDAQVEQFREANPPSVEQDARTAQDLADLTDNLEDDDDLAEGESAAPETAESAPARGNKKNR